MSSLRRLFHGRAAALYALPLLALAFVAAVALSGALLRGVRLDLTQNRQYTLSDGTLRILGKLDRPVQLRLYYSEQAARGLPQFRVFANRADELLQEIVARSRGKVTLERVDPEPFSPAEDDAAGAGLSGVPFGSGGDRLYFGLVGSNGDGDEVTMPFIQPGKEAFLEYDVAKLIASLADRSPPVLALLSDLPTGPGIGPGGVPSAGWAIDRQLSEMFELRRLQPGSKSIGDDVDVLMVVHPKRLSDDTQYAIDQFVLRGGHLLLFVDPDAESDPSGNLLDPVAMAQGRSSDASRLFDAWGIEYNPVQVVLDRQRAMLVQPDPQAPPVRHPAILGLDRAAMNQRDVVSAELEAVNLASAGALALAAGSPLRLEPLLQTSDKAGTLDSESVRLAAGDPAQLQGQPLGNPGRLVLAARFTGELASAFPERAGAGHLARSRVPANLIVVADTDLLSDRLWVQSQNFLGQDLYNPFANNGDFVFNAVDNLIGNDDLVAVRTRVTASRPFRRVEAIRRGAEQRFQQEERRLQQQLAELEEKLQRLQPDPPEDGSRPLSAQQQAELQRYQQQKVQMRKALREVQHQLNADIDALGHRLKAINILAMPALVLLLTLLWSWRRRALRSPAHG